MQTKNLSIRALMAIAALCSIPLVSFAAGGVETLAPYLSTTFSSSGNYTFTNIQPFNTSLGQLIGVEFTLTLDQKAEVTVTNDMSSSGSYKGSADFKAPKVTLDIPTTSGTDKLTVNGETIDIGPKSGTLGGYKDKTFTETAKNDNTTVIFDPTSMYTSGPYSLDAVFKDFSATFTGNTSGCISYSGCDDLTACLEVQYIYSDCCCSVPEPSTWALMGLSLVGLVAMRRKTAKA